MQSPSDRAVRILGLIAFGTLAWSLLGFSTLGGSERFYLLVPPFGLALLVVRSAAGRSKLKRRIGLAGGCAGG
ncbi:MAG TPA: hypothetical protein VKU02_16800, partial [Gemmataceae bacterium]|nr:hypothetical protein [Gemmataceae bacterium]